MGRRRLRNKRSTRSAVRIVLVLLTLLMGGTGFTALYYYGKFTYLVETRLLEQTSVQSAIYARAFEIYRGQQLSPKRLRGELERSGYRPRSQVQNESWYEIRGNRIRFGHGSSPEDLQVCEILFDSSGGRTRVRSIESQKGFLRKTALKPPFLSSFFGKTREKRRPVRFEDLPKVLLQAILAAEDEHFFSHPGLDWWAILRASAVNLIHWAPLQGGSTITQQFVKNYFLTPEKSLKRKIEEIYMAMLLENRFSKKEIFEFYANHVYLGQAGSFAITGLGQAALTYFGKDPQDLNLSESALLAGIIQAPNRYSPFRHPEAAIERRNYILDLMQQKDFIDHRERESALQAELAVLPESHQNYSDAPYFVDYVRELLEDEWSIRAREARELNVHTTLDPVLQKAAFLAVKEGIVQVEKALFRIEPEKKPQAALLAVDPSSGEILALIGGRDYAASQFNRSVHARRQPGSTFKPFVYAAALKGSDSGRYPGAAHTLSSLILDEPYTVHFEDRSYAPANYRNQYHGPITLREALALSLNVPTVKLAEEVRFESIVDLARALGMNDFIEPYPSVALGAFEVSLLELAQAYTVFANQGSVTPLHALTGYEDDKRSIEIAPRRGKRVLRPEIAFLITSALETALNEGTARAVRALGFHLPAAGKTGTSDDSWFIGYTPDLLCAVWVGLDESRPLGLTGAQAALPVWTRFMLKADDLGYLSGKPFQVPNSIVTVEIDTETGLRASDHCQHTRTEYYIAGTEPVKTCAGEIPPTLELADHPRVHDKRERGGFFGWIKGLFR